MFHRFSFTAVAPIVLLSFIAACAIFERDAAAQSFGVELHATMNPAAGGMAGASIAQPQDIQSAFTGNPATLTQFRGTQFGLSGGWAEPTINIDNNANLPLAGISPFRAKSEQIGSGLGNIGVTQDFSAYGMPITVGAALHSGAGLGVRFMTVPESNGSIASMLVLHAVSGFGAQVTDRLSIGAQAYASYGVLDGPFSGIAASTGAYAIRGLIGTTYKATDHSTLGFYWMTKEKFNFEDAVRLSLGGGMFSVTQDIRVDLPETFGLGISNDRLMNGRLLLATDLLYKRYSRSNFFKAIWGDQLVLQTGAQYQLTSRIRLRAGYAFAENIMLDANALAAGGVVPPDGLPAIQYLQSQFASINEHRITGGFGVRDLLPGVDFDASVGGMFNVADQFGASGANAESYWVAVGITWRFGRGSCEQLPVADGCGAANSGGSSEFQPL